VQVAGSAGLRYVALCVDHFRPSGLRGDFDETLVGLTEAANQQHVTVVGAVLVMRVEIIARDAVVNVRGR
jgi:hypothetical protein